MRVGHELGNWEKEKLLTSQIRLKRRHQAPTRHRAPQPPWFCSDRKWPTLMLSVDESLRSIVCSCLFT